MSKMGSSLSDKWESLLNHHGHTHRKLDRYKLSISLHQQALVLSTQNPNTYSSLGYVQTLTGDITNAVERFLKALGINMVTSVIELMNCVVPFTDTMPRIPAP